MEFTRNIQKSDYGMSGEVYISLFNKYIRLEFNDNISVDYVHLCTDNLNSLGEETILAICNYLLLYCKDVMSNLSEVAFPEGLYNLSSPREILSFITPISLEVDKPDNWKIPALNLYCKCDWDQDNDLQILINCNQVVYVGPFDGLNSWQKNLSQWNNYVVGSM